MEKKSNENFENSNGNLARLKICIIHLTINQLVANYRATKFEIFCLNM